MLEIIMTYEWDSSIKLQRSSRVFNLLNSHLNERVQALDIDNADKPKPINRVMRQVYLLVSEAILGKPNRFFTVVADHSSGVSRAIVDKEILEDRLHVEFVEDYLSAKKMAQAAFGSILRNMSEITAAEGINVDEVFDTEAAIAESVTPTVMVKVSDTKEGVESLARKIGVEKKYLELALKKFPQMKAWLCLIFLSDTFDHDYYLYLQKTFELDFKIGEGSRDGWQQYLTMRILHEFMHPLVADIVGECGSLNEGFANFFSEGVHPSIRRLSEKGLFSISVDGVLSVSQSAEYAKERSLITYAGGTLVVAAIGVVLGSKEPAFYMIHGVLSFFHQLKKAKIENQGKPVALLARELIEEHKDEINKLMHKWLTQGTWQEF